MKYSEIIRLYEKKDHIIMKTNMTDEQKAEVIEFFNKHREQESQISGDEWNKPELLTYERFKQVMDAFNNRQTKSRADKIANKVGIAGITEGKDYVDWGEFNDELLGKFHAYTPLTHLGAKTIAGKTVKPINPDKDSAGWCIGYSKNIYSWKRYFFNYKACFLILCGDKIFTKKVCFEINNYNTLSSNAVKVWDYYDKSYDLEWFLDEISDADIYSDIYMSTKNLILDLCTKAKEVSDSIRDALLKEEDEKRKEKEKSEFLERTQGLEIRNLTYKGYDFPMVEMGERPEGKVFGSYYLIADEVPFSPKYKGEKCYSGFNHWDISIVRQWLNSDLPAGQWYKEYEVDGYKVDWGLTPEYVKNFIENTDGFLRIVGLNKSQLNPVRNVTYTTDGEKIITEDYVWIPSLTELSFENRYKEGEPLDYWRNQNIFGDDNKIMKNCNTLKSDWCWTRSTSPFYSNNVWCIFENHSSCWDCASDYFSLLVLMCFKS